MYPSIFGIPTAEATAIKRILNINSNLNVSVDNKSVLPNDFASIMRRVIPIRDIIGIRYLNY